MKQYDLFLDSRSTRLHNALLLALRRGKHENAQAAYDELRDLDPAGSSLHHAPTLIEALRTPPAADVGEGLTLLGCLEDRWTSAAEALLGKHAHEFLQEKWRSVGDSLASEPFERNLPDRHSSYAYARCDDWGSVERSILRERDYATHPVLLVRMAEALGRQSGRWGESVSHWFELCWTAPDLFRSLMERDEIEDPVLRAGWESAMDEDIDPEIGPSWFPAWMLICEPGIARTFSGLDARTVPNSHMEVANGPAAGAFEVLRRLACGDGRDSVLRMQLKRLHPGLLRCYLARR